MSYVLDGIPTAMVEEHETVGGHSNGSTVRCPCGWQRWDVSSFTEDYRSTARSVLRFHYTHCEMARVTDQEENP